MEYGPYTVKSYNFFLKLWISINIYCCAQYWTN